MNCCSSPTSTRKRPWPGSGRNSRSFPKSSTCSSSWRPPSGACCRQMSENIGLIAGKGQFPLLFAQAARSHGVEVVAVAHRGETDPALASLVKELHWVYVGQLGKIIRIFKEAGVRRAVMAGGISRGRLFREFRPDFRALSVVRRAGRRQGRPPSPGGGRGTGNRRHHHRPLHPFPGRPPGPRRAIEPPGPLHRGSGRTSTSGCKIAKEIGAPGHRPVRGGAPPGGGGPGGHRRHRRGHPPGRQAGRSRARWWSR